MGDLPPTEATMEGIGTEPTCDPLYRMDPFDPRSEQDIWNCINNHRLSQDYHYLHYSCNAWLSEAMIACGISSHGPNPY
jgi:hypothetical protein